MKSINLLLVFVLLLFLVLASPVLRAQQPEDDKSTDTDKPKQEAVAPVPVAPVPAPIIAARKVFISNAGGDNYSMGLFRRLGEPDALYNRFYAAMKKWGRYELVAGPAEADLVFEVRLTVQVTGSVSTMNPQLGLSILDSKTHFLLWELGEPVEGAFRKATFQKNVDQGVARLLEQMKRLVAQPVAVAK